MISSQEASNKLESKEEDATEDKRVEAEPSTIYPSSLDESPFTFVLKSSTATDRRCQCPSTAKAFIGLTSNIKFIVSQIKNKRFPVKKTNCRLLLRTEPKTRVEVKSASGSAFSQPRALNLIYEV
jgi:hypothetical protein